jgi:ribonuclease P protein component
VPARSKPARRVFGANRRLSRSAEFERLLAHGTRRSLSGYTFYMERRAEGPPRLGMLVTRKHAAKATERNGIKRCIREAFRLEQARLGALDVLVRPPYGARASAAMLARLRELFGGLGP